MRIVFDIETKPLPSTRLDELRPPFDRDSVKTGNYGPEKAKEKIDQAERDYVSEWAKDCALSAATSCVLAIGYKSTSSSTVKMEHGEDEPQLIQRFWERYRIVRKQNGRIIGHFSNHFDVPYLVRRSYVLGIPVPDDIFVTGGYLNYHFVDTCDMWKMPRLFSSDPKPGTLAFLAKVLDLPIGKMEGVTGEHFHELYYTRREVALEYLRLDVMTSYLIAEKFGVI